MRALSTPKGLPCFMRSWVHVDASGCWVWTGPTTEDGIPIVRIEGQEYPVTRLTYEWKFGAVTRDVDIGRDCGKLSCINPNHLFLIPVGDDKPDGPSDDCYAVIENPGIMSARTTVFEGDYGACIGFIADNYTNDEVLELSVEIKKCHE